MTGAHSALQPRRHARRVDPSHLAGIVLPSVLAVAARWPSLHQPLDRDTAAYATIGSALWEGLLPYRDLFDHKQPLVYAVYAAIDVFGPRTVSVRLAGMAAAVVTALAVALLTRPMLGRGRATVAGCVVAVVSATHMVEGFDLNTEHLLAPITAVAVLGGLRYRRHRAVAPVVGLVIGLAVITKAVAVFAVPAVVLPLVPMPLQWRALGSVAWKFAAAAAVPLVAVVSVYVVAGAVDSLVDSNITYNSAYVSSLHPPGDRFITPVPAFVAMLAAAAAVTGVVRLVLVGDDRTGTAALLLWLVGTWVGAKFGGRDYPHYFAPVVAPAVVLLLAPLRPAAPDPARAWPRPALLLGQLAVLAWCVRGVPGDLIELSRLAPEELALAIYGDQARIWAEYEPVGAMLRARAEPGNSLFVAGAEPGFYWFSGQAVTGRYPYDYPVLTDADRMEELQTDLCTTPPSRVLIPFGEIWPMYLGRVDRSAYDLEFVHGDVHVYRRHEALPCLPAS